MEKKEEKETPKGESAQRQDRLGLALSGGGFRASFFHIGVLAQMARYPVLLCPVAPMPALTLLSGRVSNVTSSGSAVQAGSDRASIARLSVLSPTKFRGCVCMSLLPVSSNAGRFVRYQCRTDYWCRGYWYGNSNNRAPPSSLLCSCRPDFPGCRDGWSARDKTGREMAGAA